MNEIKSPRGHFIEVNRETAYSIKPLCQPNPIKKEKELDSSKNQIRKSRDIDDYSE